MGLAIEILILMNTANFPTYWLGQRPGIPRPPVGIQAVGNESATGRPLKRNIDNLMSTLNIRSLTPMRRLDS